MDERMPRAAASPAALVLLLAGLAGPLHAVEPAGPLGAAIRDGTPSLYVRYRFEHVHDDLLEKNASLDSAQLRLGYRTAAIHGLSATLELSAVRHLAVTDRIGPGRPPIADPETTRVNRVHLDYEAPRETRLRIGNQRITLDNVRWVGNVGFRQQEQTYQAVRLRSAAFADLELDLTYANRVNRIGDFTAQPGDFGLVNLRYEGLEAVTLTGYWYGLDYDDDTRATVSDSVVWSSHSYGVRASGDRALTRQWTLHYAAELARQSDAGGLARRGAAYDFSATYGYVELGAASETLTLTASHELLGSGGRDKVALQTPLATLHAHNGWTDQFLRTPNDGLETWSLSASWRALPRTRVAAHFDHFSSDEGGRSYGREWALRLLHTLPGDHRLEAKYAYFEDGGLRGGNDVGKLWLSVTASF